MEPRLSDDAKARPKAEVVYLGASTHHTVDQALSSALHFERDGVGYEDVMIVGYDKDGELSVRSSHISREWALWLAHELMDYIRKAGRHQD